MTPLLWSPERKPPEPDDGKLVGAFVVLTFVMWGVVILGQMIKGGLFR